MGNFVKVVRNQYWLLALAWCSVLLDLELLLSDVCSSAAHFAGLYVFLSASVCAWLA